MILHLTQALKDEDYSQDGNQFRLTQSKAKNKSIKEKKANKKMFSFAS